jgi:hypothetical protein
MIIETRTDRENATDDLICSDDFKAMHDQFWWGMNYECYDWMNARELAKASKIKEEVCTRFLAILQLYGVMESKDDFWYRVSTNFIEFYDCVSFLISNNLFQEPDDFDWIEEFINLDIPSMECAIGDLGIKGEIVATEILPNIFHKKFVPADKTDEIMMSLALP